MIKLVVYFILIGLFVQCKTTNLIDGDKTKVLMSECGRVELSSKSTREVIIHIKPLDGDLSVNVDYALVDHAISGTRLRTRIWYKGEQRSENFIVEKGETLEYYVYGYLPEEYRKGFFFDDYNNFYIRPTNFLLCDDKQLITDTLKIYVGGHMK